MIRQVKIPDEMQWAKLVDEIEATVEDTSMICWVGSADGHYAMTWKSFKSLFYDTEYRVQGGYCALASDLVVVLTDGSWYEQDKTNGYLYHRWSPVLQPDFRPFRTIIGQGSSSLTELNADDEAAIDKQMEAYKHD